MKRKKEILWKIFMISFTFFVLGTGFSVNAKAAPKLNKTKITLTVGNKKKLKVKNTRKKVKWSSKNKAVASVNKKGVVKAKKKGKTTIIAKVGKKKLRCKVIVKKISAKKTSETVSALKTTWNNYVGARGEKTAYFLETDYDGNGVNEAFGITGIFDGEMCYSNVKIYFISSSGAIKCIRSVTKNGYSLYGCLLPQKKSASSSDKYFISASGSKFIVWEITAYGSGSLSIILGVRKGEAYEPYISENYMEFRQQSSTEFVGLTSDFSKGFHDYIKHRFTFVKSTGQFVLK